MELTRKADPLALAQHELERTLPPRFSFAIPEKYLEGLTDIQLAIDRAKMMRRFEAKCRELGYSILHEWDEEAREWLYELKQEATTV